MKHQAADKYYGLISKSEAEGFIAVFPNGYGKLNSGKFASWSAGKCCAGARGQKIGDAGFARKIIGSVTRQLRIER